jgi:hypothetical protein
MSDQICSPRAVGFLRPAVILPVSLPEQLTESEFDQIVLHELTHLCRGDDWTNLAQKGLEALFPFTLPSSGSHADSTWSARWPAMSTWWRSPERVPTQPASRVW